MNRNLDVPMVNTSKIMSVRIVKLLVALNVPAKLNVLSAALVSSRFNPMDLANAMMVM